jgi:hypothetical protein
MVLIKACLLITFIEANVLNLIFLPVPLDGVSKINVP